MVSARLVKFTHLTLFGLMAVASIVALAISSSLVTHYNKTGYPPRNTGVSYLVQRKRIQLT